MAKSRTSFKPGQSGNPKGRPKGARDRAPRTFRALAQRFVTEHDQDITDALDRGVKDKRNAHRYLAILAGLERQQVELTGKDGGPIEVHDHFNLPASS